MTVFDLLFLFLALIAVATLVTALVLLLTGRRERAGRIMRRVGVVTLAYFAVLLATSVASPRRVMRIGEPMCADDWCITVMGDSTVPAAGDSQRHDVRFELRSRAKRVPQRERFVVAYLEDTNGVRHDAVAEAGEVPFDTILQPAQSVTTVRHYLLGPRQLPAGIVVTREGGANFPQCCIIDEDGSFLHKRTLVHLQ